MSFPFEPTYTAADLGRAITTFREQIGLTLGDVTRRIARRGFEVSPDELRRIENGEIPIEDIQNIDLMRIAWALGNEAIELRREAQEIADKRGV